MLSRREKCQDKRIGKPKVEKGRKGNGKGKKKKKTRKCDFIANIEESVHEP